MKVQALRFIDRSLLYSDPAFHAAFPAICVLADGNLLLLFRRARDIRILLPNKLSPKLDEIDHLDCRSHIAALRLNKDLEPLGEVSMLPMDSESVDQDASVFVLPDSRILLASFSWYPFPADMLPELNGRPHAINPLHPGQAFMFWGGYTRIGSPDARKWKPRNYLPALPGLTPCVPGRRALLGGAIRGSIARSTDGTLYLASYASTSTSSVDNGCYLMASRDNGKRWLLRGQIARRPEGKAIGLAEPSLVITPSNRLLAFFRTFGNDDRIVSAEIDPGSGNATRFRFHQARGHPCHLARLPDDRIVMTYGQRSSPFGVRVRVLDSEAEGVDSVSEVIVADAPAADCGYPWATMTFDNTLIIAYYAADLSGTRGIYGVRYAL